jgi:hypothetical protein
MAAANIAQAVEDGKREIREDIASGRFTAQQIRSFSDLHDFVDANEYGGLCEEQFSQERFSSVEAWVDHGNAVQGALDAWIKGGGLV